MEFDPVFGLSIPIPCSAVPNEILNPRIISADKDVYGKKGREPAELFGRHIEQFLVIQDSFDIKAILAAGPKV